jgi:hypothetical protein
VLGAISGSVDLSIADAKLVGTAVNDFAGVFIAGLGDVNGDARDDVAVSAPNAETSSADSGAVYLLLGSGL